MIAVNMEDGEWKFGIVGGMDEFWQRVLNSLKIYDTECFYNEKLGLNIRMIFEQKVAEYKLEHIKGKLMEWYSKELDAVEYDIISEEGRTLRARLYLTHKKYSRIEREVTLIA